MPSATQRRPRGARKFFWETWTDRQLLDMRICDLGVTFEGSWIESCVEQLYAELEQRELSLRPHFWLSSEWFSPDGVPGIAAPFYLAHPRLTRLERRMMLEAEGSSREECMKILRHECGHAYQHAFQLQRRHRWQELFGLSSRRYPTSYRPKPMSRRYVQHLRLYYAQSHPDEDFAETFAVCFQPRAVWRKRYEGWPALKKLEYVESLLEELKASKPEVRSRAHVEPLHSIRKTLREFYAEKQESYQTSYPAAYDRDLNRLFSSDPKYRDHEFASAFLRRHRAEIRRLVSRWTGEYQFTLEQVLNEMIGRCRELKLRAVGSERQLRMDFAVLLTVKTMHFLYSRGHRIAV